MPAETQPLRSAQFSLATLLSGMVVVGLMLASFQYFEETADRVLVSACLSGWLIGYVHHRHRPRVRYRQAIGAGTAASFAAGLFHLAWWQQDFGPGLTGHFWRTVVPLVAMALLGTLFSALLVGLFWLMEFFVRSLVDLRYGRPRQCATVVGSAALVWGGWMWLRLPTVDHTPLWLPEREVSRLGDERAPLAISNQGKRIVLQADGPSKDNESRQPNLRVVHLTSDAPRISIASRDASRVKFAASGRKLLFIARAGPQSNPHTQWKTIDCESGLITDGPVSASAEGFNVLCWLDAESRAITVNPPNTSGVPAGHCQFLFRLWDTETWNQLGSWSRVVPSMVRGHFPAANQVFIQRQGGARQLWRYVANPAAVSLSDEIDSRWRGTILYARDDRPESRFECELSPAGQWQSETIAKLPAIALGVTPSADRMVLIESRLPPVRIPRFVRAESVPTLRRIMESVNSVSNPNVGTRRMLIYDFKQSKVVMATPRFRNISQALMSDDGTHVAAIANEGSIDSRLLVWRVP